jgi:hypothetical protein
VPRYDARRFGKITGICALCHEGNEKEALGWVVRPCFYTGWPLIRKFVV